ncbi:MAG TPA: ABC transporter permease, partial [Egibacteraceae bacterium]|nr:ABC transporter permease [Egibacteraceae bacterium]
MRAVNPVLRRELVERWRSRRATVTLTAYLTVVGAITYLLYRIGQALLNEMFRWGGGPDAVSAGPILGRFLVESLLFFVMLLVLFIMPGYAAAQLTGEKERRTLPLLQVTLLRPRQIVLGKLGASLAWMSLLVVVVLPIGAAAFFLGGVALSDLVRGIVYILGIAVSVAGVALAVSSLTKRTAASIVLTYGIVLALVAGTLFIAAVEAVVRIESRRAEGQFTPVALYLNPFFGLSDAARAGAGMEAFFMGGGGLPSPLGAMAQALPDAELMQAVDMGGGFDGFEQALIGPPPRRPVWLIVLGIYLLMGVGGVAI